MTDKKQDPTSDAARSDPAVANKDREELKEQAEKGMRDAKGKLPKDQVWMNEFPRAAPPQQKCKRLAAGIQVSGSFLYRIAPHDGL